MLVVEVDAVLFSDGAVAGMNHFGIERYIKASMLRQISNDLLQSWDCDRPGLYIGAHLLIGQ